MSSFQELPQHLSTRISGDDEYKIVLFCTPSHLLLDPAHHIQMEPEKVSQAYSLMLRMEPIRQFDLDLKKLSLYSSSNLKLAVTITYSSKLFPTCLHCSHGSIYLSYQIPFISKTSLIFFCSGFTDFLRIPPYINTTCS